MRSWKKFKNYEVLIDENKLICATGKGRPLYPYRWSKQANAWIKDEIIVNDGKNWR